MKIIVIDYSTSHNSEEANTRQDDRHRRLLLLLAAACCYMLRVLFLCRGVYSRLEQKSPRGPNLLNRAIESGQGFHSFFNADGSERK